MEIIDYRYEIILTYLVPENEQLDSMVNYLCSHINQIEDQLDNACKRKRNKLITVMCTNNRKIQKEE